MHKFLALYRGRFLCQLLAMSQPVTLPLWLLVLILAFAGVTFASHFLFPSVRWFFRRRMERVVARLNARLERPIQPFKLMRRHDMIMRLIHDPDVMEAVVEEASNTGVPEQVVLERARRYAREIVPAFSASIYFGIAQVQLLGKVRQLQFSRRFVDDQPHRPFGRMHTDEHDSMFKSRIAHAGQGDKQAPVEKGNIFGLLEGRVFFDHPSNMSAPVRVARPAARCSSRTRDFPCPLKLLCRNHEKDSDFCSGPVRPVRARPCR